MLDRIKMAIGGVMVASAIALWASVFNVNIPAVAQGFVIPDGAALAGHVNANGNLGTLTGCTIVAGSTDSAGECTTSATSGSIAFSKTYTVAPTCVVVDKTSAGTVPQVTYTTTATQITLTTVTSAHVLVWSCFGKIGST